MSSKRCPVARRAGPAGAVWPYVHVRTDSLRAALDATVLSPTGQAVGVDDDGRVVGVTTFDQLRAAIQAADRPRPPRTHSAPGAAPGTA